MYKDFVLIGPKSNPVDIGTTDKILKALKKIAKQDHYLFPEEMSLEQMQKKKVYGIY